MSRPKFFRDNGHVFIAGITGSRDDMGGKTALANWWLCEPLADRDLRIFYNAKGSPCVRGDRVHSVKELAKRMADGVRHFDFVPRTEDWAAPHQRLRQFVSELPTEMSKAVVHDETPEYEGETGSLAWFVKVAGQSKGVHAANCKSLVLAQDPTDTAQSTRKQTPTHVWVGPTSTDYRQYFASKSFSNHFDAIIGEQDPYEWTVMMGPRDDDRERYTPVAEEYAEEP